MDIEGGDRPSENADNVATGGRWHRLRAASQAAHARLDRLIMAAKPFASRDAYGRFLYVQHAFHSDIDRLYDNPQLAALIPHLERRRRLPLIARDLADLGLPIRNRTPVRDFQTSIDRANALGWLYVAEGSNLGAAFLLKEAARLGLSEDFGARHLAAAPEGRGLSWRNFTAALDGVDLSCAEDARVDAGANAAFSRVRELAEILLTDAQAANA
jgi:heme oxygenase